nr:MAG: ORF1 [Torque teno midi virus]
MPFWWNRRRRPWYGPWRKRRFLYKKRRRRFTRKRRRYRRPTRRRRGRRRKYKVRRKKQKINIQQWQPDKIRKCKIKGQGMLVAGAEGNQFYCYTDQKEQYTQPRAPGGGGFGVEVLSLEYLYKQWEAHKNVWTSSNDYLDLCRYTGCKISFYRHQDIDFIISYDRQPPFNFKKDTYSHTHPQLLLLQRHKKILLSTKSNPKGRNKLTLKIKPPKQMSTKWFFQEQFADYGLVKIQAAAAQFNYSLYGPNTQSPNITIHALNTTFYKRHNWAQNVQGPWLPYLDYPQSATVNYIDSKGKVSTVSLSSYYSTIDRQTGFFQTGVLTAVDVKKNGQSFHERPVAIGRYNPEEDTGIGNKVWFVSVVADSAWATPRDTDLIIVELPLYIAFYGFWDYIVRTKGKVGYMQQGMFVVQSSAIKPLTPTTQKAWPILDYSFILGNMPYDETLTTTDSAQWYPTAFKQRQIINAIVESGPYVPKLYNLKSSTWQLPYTYCFYFKWGGQQITDNTIQDPKGQETYPVPDKFQERIQVIDPVKQKVETFLRPWDFRRGFVTETAFKRMSENLRSDVSFQSDDSEPKKKKRKVTAQVPYKNPETEEVQSCLLSLLEEDSSPEQTDNIQQQLQFQYKQQQKLKHNILKLLTHIKKKQRMLQLTTGVD